MRSTDGSAGRGLRKFYFTRRWRDRTLQAVHEREGKPNSAGPDRRHSLIHFPPFRLDPVEQRLWRGNSLIPIKPKTFAILLYMLERPERLITKQELFSHFWGDVHVSESVLKTHFGEIRQALGDRAKSPRFIETARGLGYRFTGRIEPAAPSSPLPDPSRTPQRRPSAPFVPSPASHFVGREAELGVLTRQLARAVAGERQVTFVTGEPGIGKTTLVNAFLAALGREELWVAWGQCINQYGAGEPYLPVLEALRRLCRQPGAEVVASSLRRGAPAWLLQMLGLLDPSSPLVRTPSMPGPILRELTEALEMLTEQRPLVLLIEDLHWADHSTLDLIAYAAQRSDPAQLVILATYRPLEVLGTQHRLASVHHELRTHDRCKEMALPHLTRHAVADYLASRFFQQPLPSGLAELTHRRCQGNALFMVRLIDAWLEQGSLIEQNGRCELRAGLDELARCVPDTVVRLIERELEQLSTFERTVLQAASAAGNEFSTATVAAALLDDLIHVDELCRLWARRGQFLRAHGQTQWNDSTVSERCSFSHVLYQQVLYEQVGPARRVQLHRRIGERLEAGYGRGAREIAAELAVHFQRGQEPARAVEYLRIAGEHALRKGAHHEAVDHFRRALDLVPMLPQASDKARVELELCICMGPLLSVTKGYGGREVKDIYTRAAELCETREETPPFPVMSGIATFHMCRGAHRKSCELGQNLLELARRHQDSVAAAEAALIIGMSLHHLGEHMASKMYLEQAKALYSPAQHHAHLSLYGIHPGIFSRCFLAVGLCVSGHPDQAKRMADEALSMARELSDSVSSALALNMSAYVHHLRREYEASYQAAEAVAASSREGGLPFYLAMATLLKGAASVQVGAPTKGAQLLELGWAELKSTGTTVYGRHWVNVLAETYCKAGRIHQALEVLDSAESSEGEDEERLWEAERFRIRAEALMSGALRSSPSSIEACLLKALEIARQQQAKLFELRAAMSLCKYWRQAGKAAEGRALLIEVYTWFTEGFDTPDLKEAESLIRGGAVHA